MKQNKSSSFSRVKLIIVVGILALIGGALFVAYRTFIAPKNSIATLPLPYVQEFHDVDLKKWIITEGVWTIRDEHLAQTATGDRPSQIFVPSQLPNDQPYHVSTYLTFGKSSRQAGIAFNAQYPQVAAKQHRAFVERRLDDSTELVAGYMDETGSFIPQAQIPLSTDTQDYRLDLFVYANTYLVQLNGQRLMQERPLFYHNGLVGFHALGPAQFDTFKLTPADDVNPNDQVYTSDFAKGNGAAGWVPISGEWSTGGGELTQSDAKKEIAAIAYETSTFTDYVMRATFHHLQGTGAGVLFNMVSPYDLTNSHTVRFSSEADALLWGYYDAQGIFVRQGLLQTDAKGDSPHTIEIYSGDTSYDIRLDGTLVARDIPLEQTRGSIGLVTSHAAAKFSSVEAFPLFGAGAGSTRQPTQQVAQASTLPASQSSPVALSTLANLSPTPFPQAGIGVQGTGVAPTPRAGSVPPTREGGVTPTPLAANSPIVVTGAAKPYSATFDGSLADAGWRVIGGEWKFVNGAMTQSNAAGFDQSTAYVRSAYRSYSLTVTVNHLQGTGAGVLFNMPYNSRLNGAHMVRYSERRPNAIIYGYFDATGKFVGQGYADVPPPGSDRHTFRIVSGDSTYAITLDGTLIVDNLPLTRNFGYVGVITSSAAANFESFQVDSTTTGTGTFSATDGFSNLTVLDGKWTTQGNFIRQEVTAPGDYVLNTGVYASEYTLETQITLPDDDRAGGGVLIQMPERGSKKNGNVIRLANGGASVLWGVTNDESKFVGQGSGPIPPGNRVFLFQIAVSGSMMQLTINGQTIFKDQPVSRSEGWIGLLSFGGPVTFEKIKLKVTKPKPD